jgi:hypothetical protein
MSACYQQNQSGEDDQRWQSVARRIYPEHSYKSRAPALGDLKANERPFREKRA